MEKLSVTMTYIEECLSKVDKGVHIEMTVKETVNDSVPDGYVEDKGNPHGDYNWYEKVIDAKDGIPTKTITLQIHD